VQALTVPASITPPRAGRPRGRDALRLAALAAAVLSVHALLMQPWAGPGDAARRPGEAMVVRQLPAAPAPRAVDRVDSPEPVVAPPAPAPAPAPTPAPPRRARRPAVPPVAALPVATAAGPVASAAQPDPAASAVVDTPAVAAAPMEPDAGSPPPLYAVQPPPSVTIAYEFRRGAVVGPGRLSWTLEGTHYALTLEAAGPVVGPVLVQRSTGELAASGLAPRRFTDWRRRRSERAVSFDPGEPPGPGRIRFSANAPERVLWPGIQDRLSWMPQLAGIVRAWPEGPPAPGTSIELDVAGAAGDVQRWVFDVVVGEPPALGPALLPLERRQHASDGVPSGRPATRVQVWLDPQRHFLPARLLWSDGNGEPVELRATTP
jgi:hypothetical protein